MTSKEKADEIFIDMLSNTFDHNESNECRHTAKMCALIAIDEIINCDLESTILGDGSWTNPQKYWKEVKEEILLK